MMRNGIRGALAVMLMATVAYAQKVTVDSDPAAPFATYKTYAWTAGTAAPNPLSEERLHQSVDARLAGKGLAMNTATPDLIVATHVTTKEKQELIANGFGYGPWGFGGGFGGATVETFVGERQADEEHGQDEQGARQDVREVPDRRGADPLRS